MKEHKNETKEDLKVRLEEKRKVGLSHYTWKTVKPGEVIECYLNEGVSQGLTLVEEKKTKKELADEKKAKDKAEKEAAKKTAEEVKQTVKDTIKADDGDDESKIADKRSEYLNKLKEIDGVGAQTAFDIETAFPTEEDLKQALKDGKELPFRNDVAEKLKKVFG